MANSNDGGGTGRKPASNAGKLLRDPKTPKKVKDVAASDLAQAPRNRGGGSFDGTHHGLGVSAVAMNFTMRSP
jgi:hypothetical protein